MLCLSLCHSVFTKETESGAQILYQASSPDEMSLVSAARYFKYIFLKREIGNEIILQINNINKSFEVTHVLEYTSDRKRMSIIVKSPDGKIYLFSKGADIVMKERISQNKHIIRNTEKYLAEFANAGLRTLIVAYKELNVEEFENFDKKYQFELDHENKNLNNLFDCMESDLYLLGSTGIEDQLQDDVADTLNSFIEIGIKVWVLTGDKVETAISIAYSCKLLSNEFEVLELKEDIDVDEIKNSMETFLESINNFIGNKKFGLIICCNELAKILGSELLTNMVK